MVLLALKVFLVFIFVLLLPGYLLLKVFLKNKLFSFERFVLGVPFSIVLLFIISLILNLFPFGITAFSLFWSYIILFVIILFFHYFKSSLQEKNGINFKFIPTPKSLVWGFAALFILILFLVILLRITVFYHNIVPSATDLAHHTFWANEIIKTHHASLYGKPDFIVGEHLVLSSFSLLTGVSLVSVLGIIVLFLINIFTLLSVFILAWRLFKNELIALFAFFISGIFYPFEAPEANFVLGGLVGNLLGNIFIPFCLYFLYRGLAARKARDGALFLSIFSLGALGLLLSHHLSMFLFLIIVIFFLLLFIPHLFADLLTPYLLQGKERIFKIFEKRCGVKKYLSAKGTYRQKGAGFIIRNVFNLKEFFVKTFSLLKSPIFILTIIFIVLFLIFVYTPFYLKNKAVLNVLREPTSIAAFGVKFNEYLEIVGYFRVILGILGLYFIFKTIKKKSIAKLFLISWVFVLFFISWKPSLLKLDLPSGRVANYLGYPLSIIGAYSLFKIFEIIRKRFSAVVFAMAILIFVGFSFVSSLDNLVENFATESRDSEASQVHQISQYLQKKAKCEEHIASDHVYVIADQWIKNYFDCGFDYVVSRLNDFRYEPPFNYDKCSYKIVKEASTTEGKECFKKYNIKYLLLDSKEMSKAFSESADFNKIYETNNLTLWQYEK